jgi:hypothetical protein
MSGERFTPHSAGGWLGLAWLFHLIAATRNVKHAANMPLKISLKSNKLQAARGFFCFFVMFNAILLGRLARPEKKPFMVAYAIFAPFWSADSSSDRDAMFRLS